MERMHEISFEHIEDGSIRLEQQSGVDEPNMIWLHPEQLKFIARRTCGMDSATAATVEDLERRLSVLSTGLEDFVCESSIRGEILEDCRNGLEYIARLDGLLNLAYEFAGLHLQPGDMQKPQREPESSSSAKPASEPQASAKKSTNSESGLQLGLIPDPVVVASKTMNRGKETF